MCYFIMSLFLKCIRTHVLPWKWFCSSWCICVTHLIQYLPFLWKHHFNLYQRVTQAQIHLHTFCQQCSTKYLAQPYRSLFSGSHWLTVHSLFLLTLSFFIFILHRINFTSGTSQNSLSFTLALSKPRFFLSVGNYVNHRSYLNLSGPTASMTINI